MKEIYLIRHGETVMNQEMRFSGITDCKLSKQGYEQLERLKKEMKNYKIEQCYCSPLERAYLTAKSFFEKPVVIKDLHEMNFGDIEGMKFTEVEKNFPDVAKKMLSEKYEFSFPNGESRDEFRQRTARVFENILKQDENSSIAIVSHSCVIRNIISKEMVGDFSFAWKIRLGNCSITKLQKYTNNTILEFLNRDKY